MIRKTGKRNQMIDDVIINKIATINRYLDRVHEVYSATEHEFDHDYTKQDSVILNLQRACEASIDLAVRIIRIKKLGIPQSGKDAFQMLEKNGAIKSATANNKKKMIGFRNIAVHEYQTLQLPIVRSIVNNHLDDFREYIKEIIVYFDG